MPSTLTWLDYSERDRRGALDVIDLFSETGTIDELGIGTIRDAFSDLFFPGTSTIQTRACYFLLLPWTYERLERLRISSSAVADRAEREEKNLNDRLLKSSDTEGVFGTLAGRALKRLPSAAYWGGLGSWGIRLFAGHKDAYFRSLDEFYRRARRHEHLEVDDEGRQQAPANWHPHVPDPPPRFPRNVSVALRRQDADYLCDRIQARHPDSLLAELVRRAQPEDLAAEWPWQLSAPSLPEKLRRQLHHARLFSLVMHGSALLYNLMLAEALGEAGRDRAEEYEGKLATWSTKATALEDQIRQWNLDELWRLVFGEGSDGVRRRTASPLTKRFVTEWVETVRRHGPAGALEEAAGGRELIRDRELQVKGGRARLENRRHLELWGGASGADRLDFRWSGTKRILQDIFDGLARREDDAGNA